jgi:hypothetical protein
MTAHERKYEAMKIARWRTALLASVIATPAFAQQPPPPKPTQVAHQVSDLLWTWAEQLESAQQQIAALQAQVAAKDKQISDLTKKASEEAPAQH